MSSARCSSRSVNALTSAVGFLHDENPGTIEDELGEVGSGGTDNHLGDTASATFDRELDQGLEEGAQQTLVEIDAALKRIEDGTYGTCEVCGKPIGADRLRAIRGPSCASRISGASGDPGGASGRRARTGSRPSPSPSARSRRAPGSGPGLWRWRLPR